MAKLMMAVAVGAVLLPACGDDSKRVHLTYRQVAYFQEYKTSSDSFGSHGAGDGIFILFEITEIRNQAEAAVDFQFDPKRLRAVKDEISDEHAAGENLLLGAEQATARTVPAGGATSDVGCVVMFVRPEDLAGDFGNGAGMGPSGKVDLIHELDTDQPVTTKRVPGNDSFVAIHGTASPKDVQGLCG